MKISTRLASEHDKAPIWTLYQHAMKSHIESIWGWDENWQVIDFEKTFSSSATYVVEKDGEFVGYFQLDFGEAEIYLRMIALMPTVRSSKIGTALLSNLLRCSHQVGLPLRFRVFRINHAAKRFYERLGWEIESEDDVFFTMTHASNITDVTERSAHDVSPQQFALALETYHR
ncbi:GNAT family N-acetyltransferase [Allopusillimonas ginsengisoli]|uniref:GNAT family N-acetyltransferase n=1 Tax=Allopusillimonas ginsengisoli TaxID=453575 RepID=UPI001021F509|nr:GNAT family N-acetyltransferase [Allopusillimonas ginsengisoli]TEA80158.1 N-acetyltransferase [Allopusillimonas ginsengisoli]